MKTPTSNTANQTMRSGSINPNRRTPSALNSNASMSPAAASSTKNTILPRRRRLSARAGVSTRLRLRALPDALSGAASITANASTTSPKIISIRPSAIAQV
jgi:hypothetical protein